MISDWVDAESLQQIILGAMVVLAIGAAVLARDASGVAVVARRLRGSFSYEMIAAVRRWCAYSITIPHNAKVKAAAEAIGEDAWSS